MCLFPSFLEIFGYIFCQFHFEIQNFLLWNSIFQVSRERKLKFLPVSRFPENLLVEKIHAKFEIQSIILRIDGNGSSKFELLM